MSCKLASDNILHGNALFRVIYDGVGSILPASGHWCWLAYFIAGFAIIFILVNSVLLGAAFFVWLERRLVGRFHNRIGPNRWGPFGLLQPIADLVKLLIKEDIVPQAADRLLFSLAPIMMMTPVLLMLAVVPFAKNTVLADLNIGVLYVVAVSSLSALAIFTAGWSSNNRYAMFGAARGVATLISYEVPVVLSLLGVVLVAGSMSMSDVVNAQAVPFFLVQPLALFVFMTGISAELNRTPFDVMEGESELVAGFHTEYSGIKFALIQAAEFGGVLTASAVMATLFLAGWSGPLSSYLGWLWFLLKLGIFVFLFIWIRATFPRLRIDQIMALAWKFLLPLSLVNLVATSIEVYALRDGAGSLGTGDLWIMSGINLAVAVFSVALLGGMIREKVMPASARRTAMPTTEVAGEVR